MAIKRLIILPISVALMISLSLGVSAYQHEDVLYTKTKIFGMNTLECDVNDDGSTNVLDLLQIKHDMLIDSINMNNA